MHFLLDFAEIFVVENKHRVLKTYFEKRENCPHKVKTESFLPSVNEHCCCCFESVLLTVRWFGRLVVTLTRVAMLFATERYFFFFFFRQWRLSLSSIYCALSYSLSPYNNMSQIKRGRQSPWNDGAEYENRMRCGFYSKFLLSLDRSLIKSYFSSPTRTKFVFFY